MNWLKDKKNLPIVIVAAVVIVVGAVVGTLFAMGILPPQSQTASSPAAAPAAPAAASTAPPTPAAPAAATTATPGSGSAAATPPASAPATPASPSAAGPAGAKKPHAVVAKAGVKPGKTAVPGGPNAAPGGPNAAAALTPALAIAATPDPFRLPGSPAKSIGELRQEASVPLPERLPLLPDPFISNVHTPSTTNPVQPNEPLTPPPSEGPVDAGSNMRMAGVLYGNGIWALLEIDGNTKEVQPGDSTDEGKVISIEPNSMILRTSDNRLIKVPLSSTPTGSQSASYGQ